MALNLIGLGMNLESLTLEGLSAIQKSKKIYLEQYTTKIPYNIQDLEKIIKKRINIVEREFIENEVILKEAKEEEISLLVYGDALSATTHIQLILSCIQQKIKYRIYHNSSILTTISETGLQLYKFGKIASMPKWQNNYQPTSFIKYYKENKKIKAHTLILIDIGLNIKEAIKQFENACNIEGIELEKLIVISKAGSDEQKIYYEEKRILKELNIEEPFCFIIPSDMHFLEEEFLNKIREKLLDNVDETNVDSIY